MTEIKPYEMNITKSLQFCIEVQQAKNMTTQRAKESLTANAKNMLVQSDKCVVKSGEFKILSRTVPTTHPFTFSSVHNDIVLPKEVETIPMVIEVVFQESNSDKLFVRIKNDLEYYDGVTATHTAFQVLELLDGVSVLGISAYPFHSNNGPVPGANFGNFLPHLGRVLYSAATAPLFPAWWQGKWMPGAWQSR